MATARADNNQQGAAKTAAAAVAVGKRRQARGEKRGRWRRRRRRGGGGGRGGRGGSGGSEGRCVGGERPEVRVEIGVPRTLLGDYLAQIKAMRLANAYLERSQCLASRQTFICAADRFIRSRR